MTPPPGARPDEVKIQAKEFDTLAYCWSSYLFYE
jgi:hypothetical protein